MTNKELILELQKYPPDLTVLTEGCDCSGILGGVRIIKEESDDCFRDSLNYERENINFPILYLIRRTEEHNVE